MYGRCSEVPQPEGCVSGGRDNKLLRGVGTGVCQFLVMPCNVNKPPDLSNGRGPSISVLPNYRNSNSMVRKTSDKQLSRTLQGFFQDK